MREEGREELTALRQTVLAWKADYRQAKWLVGDFYKEIDVQLLPYIERLLIRGYINRQERTDFMAWAYEQALEVEYDFFPSGSPK